MLPGKYVRGDDIGTVIIVGVSLLALSPIFILSIGLDWAFKKSIDAVFPGRPRSRSYRHGPKLKY